MTAHNDLIEHLRDEEQTAAGNALAARIAAIENLPDGPLRARFCADAFMRAGQQTMRLLEGDQSTARQLRMMADMIEGANSPTN